jgi:hypothetical protein
LGDALKLHKAIAGEKLGGVGPGVSPKTALAVGLKVDSDALPESLKRDLKAGKVNLDDPAITAALLKLNAVVGIAGFFDEKGALRSIGIQCSFCHSTVDDSFIPGIGRRLDGWANRDLNVGAIGFAGSESLSLQRTSWHGRRYCQEGPGELGGPPVLMPSLIRMGRLSGPMASEPAR